jgi:hypothetical protein
MANVPSDALVAVMSLPRDVSPMISCREMHNGDRWASAVKTFDKGDQRMSWTQQRVRLTKRTCKSSASGNAIVDILSKCDDALLESIKLEMGTMQLVDEQQAASIYKAIGPTTEVSGGSVANS